MNPKRIFMTDRKMETQWMDKILKKEAMIGVIGLGYVGLPLVLRF